MEAINKPSQANDYPVARVLNNSLLTIFKALRSNDGYLKPNHDCIIELNRHYVRIVHELEKLYCQNPELTAVKPEPFWKQYDVLEGNFDVILEYLDDPDIDNGQAHNIRLNKLCILADNETPVLTNEQKKLVKDTEKAVKNYYAHLNGAMDAVHLPVIADETKYVLSYEKDGTIVLNDVIVLKKTHIGSAVDQLLEQAFKNEYKLFIPKLPKTARNLSTILSSAGITPELRRIFFPTVSKAKGVLFRPVVSRGEAKSENIDTRLIDLLLKAYNAEGIFEDLDF